MIKIIKNYPSLSKIIQKNSSLYKFMQDSYSLIIKIKIKIKKKERIEKKNNFNRTFFFKKINE